MFKRRRPAIPPDLLQQARHWRMGGRSSDTIRRELMRRGLSWEASLEAVALLDKEQKDEGRVSLSHLPLIFWWLLSAVLVVGGGLRPFITRFL